MKMDKELEVNEVNLNQFRFIYNQLIDIKNYISDEKYFEGGVELGCILSYVCKLAEEAKKKKQEDEYDDCEALSSYISRIEEEHARDCETYEKDGIEYEKKIEKLTSALALIIKLYNDDRIYPTIKPEVGSFLTKNEFAHFVSDGQLLLKNI